MKGTCIGCDEIKEIQVTGHRDGKPYGECESCHLDSSIKKIRKMEEAFGDD